MTRYSNITPLGVLTVSTAGTTIPLSTNCGSQGGGVGTVAAPALAGSAFRQFQLQADAANTGALFLLPRGKTLSGNPEAVIAKIIPSQVYTFPFGVSGDSGYLPENFVLDTDTSGTQKCYGFGIHG